jgi:hypothetical protein
MSTLKLVKIGGASMLSTMSSIHFHSHIIWTTRVKENNGKEQEMKK